MRRVTKLVCAAASVMLFVGSARAELLGLQFEDFPDIASRFIDTVYDSGSDSFTADGFALLYDDDGSMPAEDIADGDFLINALIDNTGQASGGSLTVGGTVLGFGPTLLTGSLTGFGFKDGGGPLFEFLFEVTGGDLADAYGGVGATIGVILSGVNFGGSWDEDFDNLINGLPGTGSAVSDIGIPLPAPAALAVFALAGLAGSRRRR